MASFTSPIALLCIAIWLLLAILNVGAVVTTLVRKRHVSTVPLIGGIVGMAGFWMTPHLRWFFWVPLLLDAGTVMAIRGLPAVIGEIWETSRLQELVAYRGVSARNSVITLRLFKSGRFVLREVFTLEPGETGMISRGAVGRWREDRDRIVLKSDDGEAVLTRLPEELIVMEDENLFRETETVLHEWEN